ncbi:MAG TPA: hypothetical protein VMI72_02485 [Roseiarcus sp.]|nr:hypothetical protein [Roseiarcus sp.]
MPLGGESPAIPDVDEDSDDCLCGMEHFEDEATSDEELPLATGGIEASKEEPQGDEDEIDGCELDFTAVEQTDDSELPAAVGAV